MTKEEIIRELSVSGSGIIKELQFARPYWTEEVPTDLHIAVMNLVFGERETVEIASTDEFVSFWRIPSPKIGRIERVPDLTGSLDDAMLLGAGIPWLSPVIDYPSHTVRLLNGIGLTVNGQDYASTAESMPAALTIAWVRAHLHQRETSSA